MYNFLLLNQSGFSPGFPWLFDFLVSVCPGFEFVVVDPVVGRSQSGVTHVLFAQQVVVDSLLDFSGALQSTYKIYIACQWLNFDNLTFKLQNVVDRNQLSYVVTKTIAFLRKLTKFPRIFQSLFCEGLCRYLLCVSNDEKSSTDFAYLHGFLMIPVLVSDGWWPTFYQVKLLLVPYSSEFGQV